MNSITAFFALIKKEYWELVRDKRSLFATFAYALVGPFILFILIKGIIAATVEQTPVKIGVQADTRYEQAKLKVMHFLKTKNVPVVTYAGDLPSDFSQIPIDNAFDALIRIEKPSGNGLDNNIDIVVYGDRGSQTSSQQMDKAVDLVSQFIANEKRNTLVKQGVNPFASQWQLRQHMINDQTQRTERLMDSLLIFVLLAPFFITLNYINDATAGERERGSLVPLLTQPVNRNVLLASKWMVGSVLGIIGTLCTMLIGFKLIAELPVYEIGLQFDASSANIALSLAILVPLVMCVASLQMWIALFAKNFKEGQSYLTLFSFIPLLAVFMGDKIADQSFSAIMPLLGHQQLLKGVFSMQEIDLMQVVGLSVSCVVVTVVSLLAVKNQVNSERILQGR